MFDEYAKNTVARTREEPCPANGDHGVGTSYFDRDSGTAAWPVKKHRTRHQRYFAARRKQKLIDHQLHLLSKPDRRILAQMHRQPSRPSGGDAISDIERGCAVKGAAPSVGVGECLALDILDIAG
ncbi:MAG: hypothetical protein WCE35_23955 [Bradyrhizobium sp.]